MIVTCEGCKRHFQLDDSRIPAKGARVRCKYCKHRFRVSPPGADAAGAGSSPDDPGGGMSAGAPGQISADETLFGSTGGGAPIDGDRTLFGSLDDTGVGGDDEPANDSSFGVSQDLEFVQKPTGNAAAAPADPAPAETAASADASSEESEEGWVSVPGFDDSPSDLRPSAGAARPSRAASAPPEPATKAAPPEPAAKAAPPEPAAKAAPPEPPAKAAPPEPEPAAEAAPPAPEAAAAAAPEPEDRASEDAPAAKPSPHRSAGKTGKTRSAAAPEAVPAEAAAPKPAPPAPETPSSDFASSSPDFASSADFSASSPDLSASSPDLAAASPALDATPDSELSSPPGEDSAPAHDVREDSGTWEFADSDLSIHGDPEPEDEPARGVASDAAAAESPIPPDGMELDPGSSHPDVADPSLSMRMAEPGEGTDGPVFEMPGDDDGADALELEDDPAAASVSDDSPAESAAEASAPAVEIGSASDWDRLAEDGTTPPSASEPEPHAEEPAFGFSEAAAEQPGPEREAEAEDDSGYDDAAVADDVATPAFERPPLADDLPQPAAEAMARRGNAWLEHAGWALSLVLLLAVARGTVRIERTGPETPSGQVEVAGLVAENVRGRFVDNARSGTLFVVSGELHNRGPAPAGGELRVVVLDERGQTFEGRFAPVAPALSESAVREGSVGALQQQHARLARDLGGRRLAPGESVAFQAILSEVPEGAVRFRLEPAPASVTPASPGGGAPRAPEAG